MSHELWRGGSLRLPNLAIARTEPEIVVELGHQSSLTFLKDPNEKEAVDLLDLK